MSAAMRPIVDSIPGSKKDQLKELLKHCTPTQAAAAVGCEVSYVSQLLTDPEFAEEVAVYRIEELTKQAKRDGKYDRIEDKLLDALEMKLDQGAHFLKMDVILRALQTANNAKRRSNPLQDTAPPSNIVNLIMPTTIIRQFQTNPANEVIRVGDTELISMSAQSIMAKLGTTQKKIEINSIPIQGPKMGKSNETADAATERRIEEATISAEQI